MIHFLKSMTAKQYLAYAAVMALCLGFVWSRSMYSFGLLFMGIHWVLDVKSTAYIWKNTWFLSSIALAMLVPISDILNGQSMSNVFFIKLSLPLFIAFFASLHEQKINLSIINQTVIIVLLITSCSSMSNYLFDNLAVNESYKYAKVMQIGQYSDHIRISVAIACSILIAIYEFQHSTSVVLKIAMCLYSVWQCVFLHILAARTGLVMLYASLVIYGLYSIVINKKKWSIVIIAAIALLPILSFYTFPSFYHRIGFTLYEKAFYTKREYREGSSDGIRYYSMLAGLDIYKDNKWIGVGFHQLPNESANWLKSQFPLIKSYEIIQPSSQYLLIMAASGILGLVVLLIYFIGPYFNKDNLINPYFLSVYTSMLCIMIFEIFLENQYGCFVYGFFICLTRHFGTSKKI